MQPTPWEITCLIASMILLASQTGAAIVLFRKLFTLGESNFYEREEENEPEQPLSSSHICRRPVQKLVGKQSFPPADLGGVPTPPPPPPTMQYFAYSLYNDRH